jgi:hypothetical protein
VQAWIDGDSVHLTLIDHVEPTHVKKSPEIPQLQQYKVPPKFRFWDDFPSNPLPGKPDSPVAVDKLQGLINQYKDDDVVCRKTGSV